MVWQKRGNHQYYYSWQKKGATRKKVYFGRGPVAAVVALRDQLVAAERSAEHKAFEAFAAEQEAANQLLRESHESIQQVTSAQLLLAGYYRPNRGRWRKRR